VVAWDRSTGAPLYRAIVWQDRRTASACQQLIDNGQLKPAAGYRRVNLHRIALSGRRLSEGGRLKTDYDFFEMLHRAGRRAARRFLDEHFDDIGARSTIEEKTKAA